MSMNWLEGMSMDHDMMEQPGQPMAMPVFGSAVIIGKDLDAIADQLIERYPATSGLR